MAKAGLISIIFYWYQGLVGWQQLGLDIPKVLANTAMHLGIGWVNTGDEYFSGVIELTVTKPDGLEVELLAVANQGEGADPGNGWTVQFEPIVVDQAGTYNATAVLREAIVGGEAEVLDESTFSFALVSTAGIDILTIIGPLLVLGLMVGMMAPMMKEGLKQ